MADTLLLEKSHPRTLSPEVQETLLYSLQKNLTLYTHENTRDSKTETPCTDF